MVRKRTETLRKDTEALDRTMQELNDQILRAENRANEAEIKILDGTA